MFNRLVRLYEGIINFTIGFQSYFLLVIRLYWGCSLVQTGWGKLHNIQNVVQYFQSLNIPFAEANAYFAGSVEFGCGLLLVFGLASRLACIPLIAILLGALATAHREATLNIFTDPDTFFSQAPFLFLYAALIVFSFGPGKFSIDRLVERKIRTSR